MNTDKNSAAVIYFIHNGIVRSIQGHLTPHDAPHRSVRTNMDGTDAERVIRRSSQCSSNLTSQHRSLKRP